MRRTIQEMRRIVLLLTLVGALVLACAGVVLAQSTGSESTEADSQQAAKLKDADRVAAEEKAAKEEEDAEATSEDISSLSEGDPIPDRYIVVLKGNAGGAGRTSGAEEENSAQIASDMRQKHGLKVKRTYQHALKGYAAEIPKDEVDDVRSDPRVEFVAQDAVAKLYSHTTPTGIGRTAADLSPTAKIDGIDERVNADVAVLDTGILPHSDLNRPAGVDCSTDGKANYASDDQGHGTHVAGTIGALDNSGGVVGVAPGARVWPIKVLDSGGHDNGWGTVGDTICGIDVVTANPHIFEVVNMSLGWDAVLNDNWYSADDGNCGARNHYVADAMHRAICKSVAAGVTYVVAAGNESRDASWGFPAAFDEVITVSNMADYNGQPNGGAAEPNGCYWKDSWDDYFWTETNYGNDVDIAAPGTCISSTGLQTSYYPVRKKKKGKGRRTVWVPYTAAGYTVMSGTSMASPHVAGAAAILKANYPNATPYQIHSFMVTAANTEAANYGHSGWQKDTAGNWQWHAEPLMRANNY